MHGFTSNRYIRGVAQSRTIVPQAAYTSDLDGVVVTASGSTNTKGDYIELVASLLEDTYALYLSIWGGASTVNTSALFDIATGTAGNEVIIIPNLMAGYGNNISSPSYGVTYLFQGIYLPATTRISARVQCATASRTFGIRTAAEHSVRYSSSQSDVIAYGANTADSGGVAITPQSGAFSAWVEIATTSRDHLFWVPAYQPGGDTSIGTSDMLCEFGYGPDSSNVTSLGVFAWRSTATNECIAGPWPFGVAGSVPSGTKLWGRIAGGDVESRDVAIYGI
jgi:hypothetical protein